MPGVLTPGQHRERGARHTRRGGPGILAAMRVIVGCEFSGKVRDAFRERGHDAYSCDLLPCESDPAWHIRADILTVIGDGWDLAIFHPPCTDLAVSGARWFPEKRDTQAEALRFIRALMYAPIPRIALENPVSIISSHFRRPDQVIQPWQFGHEESKATCLWLKNLPRLVPTDIVAGRFARVHTAPPSPERWRERSRTLPGIAAAMAEQWGGAELAPRHADVVAHQLALELAS